MSEFRMKRWNVSVIGHEDVTFDAATRGKAQAKAFEAYRVAYECTFREFLTRSRVARADVPATYGRPITVSGEPAFMLDYSGGNSLRFVRPGEDQIFTSHLLDTTEIEDANLSE